nr:balbiani ring protein 3-like isoform X2 [Styela clava]
MYKNKDGVCVEKSQCKWTADGCEPPKVYGSASKCPATCATPKPPQCEMIEKKQCICPPNMVQYSVGYNTCVKLEDCPKCNYNSVPTDCAPVCPETCPDDTICKRRGCQKGVSCICPPGTVRLNRQLPVICVTLDQCPPLCNYPRVPIGCGTACPATCEDPDPNCEAKCTPENICSCPEGYLQRSKKDKTCVRIEDCPVNLQCRSPAVPMKCERQCPATCEQKPWFCTVKCKSEYICGCPEEYIQLSMENKKCVREGKCPRACDSPKVFQLCPSMCQPTCDRPKITGCRRGCSAINCVCPEGMVQRDESNRTCIRLSECPGACEKPKVFQSCPSMCQPTCDRPKITGCRRGCSDMNCVCPEGMVQIDESNRTCIRLSDCPGACDSPKVFQSCSSLCQPTCDRPKITKCRRGCSAINCVCPEGMVQIDESNRTCIRPSECPVKKCEPPKVRIKCSTSCPETCDEKSRHCSNKCTSDYICGCPENYIQMSMKDQTCVKEGECPRCIPPKVYQKCALPCQPTCLFPKRTICGRSCGNRKCVCPPGMIQVDRHNYTCIEASECPKADKRIRKKRRINLPT